MGAAPIARRLGLIGDVHTEAMALEAVIGHLRALAPDRLLCTGDLADGPGGGPEVDRCCRLLREHDVITVTGNHDRWMQDEEMRDLPGATERFEVDAETLSFLAKLPRSVEIATPRGLLLLGHGLGDDDMARLQPHDHAYALESNAALQALLRERRYSFVVGGHTHRRMVRAVDGITFINPGTLLRDNNPCCALLDFERAEVRFFELTAAHAIIEADSAPLPAVE